MSEHTEDTTILSLDDVHVVYEGIISALRGVSLAVPRGQILALLGGNGAGKTTTLKAISGLLAAERGALTAGSIRFDGRAHETLDPEQLARAGLVQVLEGRHCFAHLSVRENLVAGALVRRSSRAEIQRDIARVLALFPRLEVRLDAAAGLLSGGEQQMVAIGRALMYKPRLLCIDEPSLGLSPKVRNEVFAAIKTIHDGGIPVLLVEQEVGKVFQMADRNYILSQGRIVAQGTSKELAADETLRASYLGM